MDNNQTLTKPLNISTVDVTELFYPKTITGNLTEPAINVTVVTFYVKHKKKTQSASQEPNLNNKNATTKNDTNPINSPMSIPPNKIFLVFKNRHTLNIKIVYQKKKLLIQRLYGGMTVLSASYTDEDSFVNKVENSQTELHGLLDSTAISDLRPKGMSGL